MPRRLLAIAVALVALVAVVGSAGCWGGKDLVAEDREKQAERLKAAGGASAGAAPTTRPADLEAAPAVHLTFYRAEVVPHGLALRPGLYRFEVYNANLMPRYFWLRRDTAGAEAETILLGPVAGKKGNTFFATLEEGDYLYSSPMPADANAFPLTVRGRPLDTSIQDSWETSIH